MRQTEEERIRISEVLDRDVIMSLLIIFGIIAIVVAGVVFFFFTYTIPFGKVAVIIDPVAKSMSPPIVGATWGFKAPWAYIIQDDIGVQAVDMFSEPPRDYPAVSALTRDGVQIDVDITIRYKIIPDKFDVLVKNYPTLNYEEDFIVANARQVVREVISNYTMTDILEQRTVIARAIEDKLSAVIKRDPVVAQCIDLLGVNVRNIKLPDSIIQAINDKIASQQKAIKAEYDRQATIIQANASAQALIIQAQGQAQAMLELAKAQSESIKLIANATAGVPKEIVAYFFQLEIMKQLAQSKATIIYTTGQTTPLIQIPQQAQQNG
ncbi:MAG: prohibitin family protein [Thermofilum sp.]|jgi:regulator of protease activity HflC (stomatin/prohibitin superfamily)|uniref:prohibitin family protein n=1 Tax=Thermofilum sp. TaxID=1961369 RepID=UPI00258BD48A|nr:prohibitin family protein [Thermofilum sp.]MCI4409181.1 prohibitin family protein [Thermofilum sp.]